LRTWSRWQRSTSSRRTWTHSDLALASQCIGHPAHAVADDAVDPVDADRRKGFGELIGDGLHDLSLLKAGAFVLSAALEMGVVTSTGALDVLRVS
jgi:hypothetical protein